MGKKAIHCLKEYDYIRLPEESRRLFCFQQSLFELALVLFVKTNSLNPIVRPNSGDPGAKTLVQKLRSELGYFRQQLRMIFRFLTFKSQGVKEISRVRLPRYGQTCLQVHKGYKIFDHRRKVVIKVFDQDVSQSVVEGEIELLKRASLLAFASSIGEWNIEERWYEEEYLNGSLDSSWNPMNSVELSAKLRGEVGRSLMSLILFQEPIGTDPLEYLEPLAKRIILSRLGSQKATTGEFSRIHSFVNSIVEQIRLQEHDSIFLTFTHGDFVPANMVNTSTGIRILDWEEAGERTALYDFFSYFFYRSVSRNVPVATLVCEIDDALAIFLSQLSGNAPELSKNLVALKSLYRRIFYIEMLHRLVIRQETDRQLDILHYIVSFIDAFETFEKVKRSSSSQ